jgi:recombination protein RecA
MSQALRKLTAAISRSGTAMIFINQIREKIGVMFGNPETTPGGRALKFYASIRLDVRRQEAIKSGTESLGARTKVKVVKNKLSPPFREAEFDVLYGSGIARAAEAVDLGVERGLIDKSGAWYAMGGERIGQGRDRAAEHLVTHPDVLEKLRTAILTRGPSTGPMNGAAHEPVAA